MDSATALISSSWQDYAYIEVATATNSFSFTRAGSPVKASRQGNALLVDVECPSMRDKFHGVSEHGIYIFPLSSIQYFVLSPDEYYDPQEEEGIDTPDGPTEPVKQELAWPLRMWRWLRGLI